MSRTRLTFALLIAAALSAPAPAQFVNWTGGPANNNWSTAANWTGGAAPPNDGTANPFFSDQGPNGSQYLSPNLDANYSVNSITFSGGSSFNLGSTSGRTLTVGEGGITQESSVNQTISVPIVLDGNNQVWQFTSTGNLTASAGINTTTWALILNTTKTNTLNAAITGGGSVITNNSGTAILSSINNTFTGGTFVGAGTLEITGNLPGNATIGDRSTLLFAQSGGATLAGAYSGAGNLSVSGAGIGTVFVLGSTSNSYTGATSVQSGTLRLGASGVIPDASVVTVGGTTFAVLQMAGFNETIGGLAGNQASSQVNNVLGSGANTLTVNQSTNTTYAGILGGGGTNANNFAFVKTGAGTLTLSGANTLTGGITISGGVLSITGDTNLGAASGAVNLNGGTLQITGTGTITPISANRSLTLGASGGTIDTSALGPINGNIVTIAAPISGTGPLTLNAHGDTTDSGNFSNSELILSGTNTFTGAVTISSGVVDAGSGFGNAANSIVLNGLGGLVATDMTAQTFPRNITLAGTGDRIIRAYSWANLTLSGVISGTGGLRQTDTGAIILTGPNTYTGGTTIADGTIQTGATNTLPVGGAVTIMNGNLNLGGFNQTIGSLSGGVTGNVSLGSATLTAGSDNSSSAFGGAITGSGGLTKTGSGDLTLSGLNTYTGPTAVKGGTLTIAGGTLTGTAVSVSGDSMLSISGGNVTGSTSGNLTIGGSSASVYLSSPGSNQSSLTTVGTFVGDSGNGTFNQSGGTHTVNGGLRLGADASSTGTYNLSGGTLTTIQTQVGYASEGFFTQSGGSHTINQSLYLGANQGTYGNYSLQAGQLTVPQIYDGYGGIGYFNQSGGTTTISQNLTLGYAFGSSGAYTLSGGTLSTSNTYVGSGGAGTFTQSGGTHTATVLSVDNGGTYTLNNGTLTVGSFGEYIGEYVSAVFNQSGGTNSASGAGAFSSLGLQSGAIGTYNLSGSGIFVTNFESLGYSGTGVVNQSGGEHIVGGILSVGGGATTVFGFQDAGYGAGTYNLTNGALITSNCAIGSAGTGVFNQSGGVHFATSIVLGDAGGSGTYILSGGYLEATSIQGGAGTGIFDFNGGTLRFPANLINPIGSLTAINVQIGGAIVDTNGYAVTISQALLHDPVLGSFSDGGLTKRGAGTLTLTGVNTYTGGTTIAGGILSVASDANLGDPSGPVTLINGGQLAFTASATTSRTFNLNSSTLAAAAGNSITYNGATVNGGYLSGPGLHIVTGGSVFSGVSTFNSTNISVTGPGAFVNVSNGGTINIGASLVNGPSFNGFVNQGSGSITVGANTVVNAADFQSYGLLTLSAGAIGQDPPTQVTNTGTSPMFFNGGSRTFIGTPATAVSNGQPTFVAGMDLEGKNLVIAGGLFVNNGFVSDYGNGAPGSIIVDYGALYKGAGFTGVPIVTQNGGKVQAGNSPGSASYGQFVFGPGGVSNYVFAIDDATGAAGPTPDALGHVSGWGLISTVKQTIGSANYSGDFTWTATPSDKLTFAIDTLVNPTTVGMDVAGPMADFDPNQSYSWLAVRWAGVYAGPTDAAMLDAATVFDASGFANPLAGSFGWSLDTADQSLSLTYTPSAVPEPGTFLMVGLAAAGLAWRRKRRAVEIAPRS